MIEVRFLEDCYFLDIQKMYYYNDIVKLDKDRANRLYKKGTVDILKDQKIVKEIKEEVIVEEEVIEEQPLSSKTVVDLKEIAKSLEVEGYNSMKKQELIDAIEQVR